MARPNPLAFLSVSSFVFRLLVMVGKQPWYERHKAPTVPITFNHLMSKYIYITLLSTLSMVESSAENYRANSTCAHALTPAGGILGNAAAKVLSFWLRLASDDSTKTYKNTASAAPWCSPQ